MSMLNDYVLNLGFCLPYEKVAKALFKNQNMLIMTTSS